MARNPAAVGRCWILLAVAMHQRTVTMDMALSVVQIGLDRDCKLS